MTGQGNRNRRGPDDLPPSGGRPTEAQRGTGNRYGGSGVGEQSASSGQQRQHGPSRGAVTVWAGHSGIPVHWEPGNGWQIAFETNFTALSDLLRMLDRNNLRGKISHLGIVAHGGISRAPRPGDIATTPRINAGTIASNTHVRHFFNRLRYFITRPGRLTFYSCIAGNGQAGTSLLEAASDLLPGRTVTGFTTYGSFARGTLIAGNLTDSLISTIPSRSLNGYPRMLYTSPSAKHASNGRVFQYPDLPRMWDQLVTADPAFVSLIHRNFDAEWRRVGYRVPVHGVVNSRADLDRLHSAALARHATNNWNQQYGGERDLVRRSNIRSAFEYWAVHHVGE